MLYLHYNFVINNSTESIQTCAKWGELHVVLCGSYSMMDKGLNLCVYTYYTHTFTYKCMCCVCVCVRACACVCVCVWYT